MRVYVANFLAMAVCCCQLSTEGRAAPHPKIDRKALVTRHNPCFHGVDPMSPLSVGNGELGFTVDVTGLQTFSKAYEKGMTLSTLSQWAWHTSLNPENFQYDEVLSEYDTPHGRKVKYAGRPLSTPRGKRAFTWFRENPHRLHLGRIGLEMTKADGSPVAVGDLKNIEQTLELWSGTITSRFEVEGKPVTVTTCCHPRLDMIAAEVKSPLLSLGRLKVYWHFPYAEGGWSAPPCWDKPQAHQTTIRRREEGRVDLQRQLDADQHHVSLIWSQGARLEETGPHRFSLSPAVGADTLQFTTAFSAKAISDEPPDLYKTISASADHWQKFWKSGGAIDLSQSKDPRWKELERRIVLSQYLTAIQCAGSAPPQESGLTQNSWYGKFHLEMMAWHGVHFALWGRVDLLERWMPWMRTTGLESARRRAQRQGYPGDRWNKMIDAGGSWEGPSGAGAFRTTQQGHAIYLPELCYRLNKDRKFLEQYKDMVFDSADFMASFAAWDKKRKCYVVGPPMISGGESTRAEDSQNPMLELSYWAYGLETAQRWRERLGMPRKEKWDHVLKNLAPLPIVDGRYVDMESYPNNWKGRPALLEAFGCMPGVRVERKPMEKTFEKVAGNLGAWELWGCDFPMFAMTAARLGKPEAAVEMLLYDHPRNRYLANGHMPQSRHLEAYLPTHGGLLWAVALMAAGWDGCPAGHAPGFPNDGKWVVRWEGLHSTP